MVGLRRKSKGIKIIKAVYPDTESPNAVPVHHQLDALIKYVLMNPHKLSEIGKYIEKKVKKDLYKTRYG